MWVEKGVAGVDEAGRGPLAGPVAVAAVLLDPECVPADLDDSKKLSPRKREELFLAIVSQSLACAIRFVPAQEIDRINIRAATLDAMCCAVAALAVRPERVVVDGRDLPASLVCPGIAEIEADGRHAAVAAASILAKVARDRAMAALAQHYPAYGFERHKGYATADHRKALADRGPCPLHRRSFAPCR